MEGARRAGEVVLDAGGAAQLGVGVGDEVEVFGVERRVAGLSEGLTSVACTSVFLSAEDFAAGAGPGLNYVLVGSDGSSSPEALAAAVAAAVPGATVQTGEAFSAEEAALVRDMYAELFTTMRVLGFVIALALVSLTLSSITTAKRREYGIVAALGATPGRLAAVVASQAAWAVLAATAVAVLAALGLGAAIDRALPNIELVLGPATCWSRCSAPSSSASRRRWCHCGRSSPSTPPPPSAPADANPATTSRHPVGYPLAFW
ncbi:MAG: FtsX-like permease family protein [Acidimicrobiales bacterium]